MELFLLLLLLLKALTFLLINISVNEFVVVATSNVVIFHTIGVAKMVVIWFKVEQTLILISNIGRRRVVNRTRYQHLLCQHRHQLRILILALPKLSCMNVTDLGQLQFVTSMMITTITSVLTHLMKIYSTRYQAKICTRISMNSLVVVVAK